MKFFSLWIPSAKDCQPQGRLCKPEILEARRLLPQSSSRPESPNWQEILRLGTELPLDENSMAYYFQVLLFHI